MNVRLLNRLRSIIGAATRQLDDDEAAQQRERRPSSAR